MLSIVRTRLKWFGGRLGSRWIAVVACLAAVALIVAASGIGFRVIGQAAATPAGATGAMAAAVNSATPDISAVPSDSAAQSPTPEISTQPSIADVAMAIASQSSWLAYPSASYGFSIKHPTDWTVTENPSAGWVVAFTDVDGSKFQVSWRAISKGTTLATVTDEVWKTMHDSGYTVVDSVPRPISRQLGQILTVDGPQRHGVVGLMLTPTARYRVELWTNPGADEMDATLFAAFLATLTIS